MAKELPKRSEVPVEHTWAVEDIYPDLTAWEKETKEVRELSGELAQRKGRLGESAEMLYNALRLDPAAYADVSLTFADLASIPESALPAVRALYQLGIVAGTVGKDGQLYFNPQNGLTRAQASAMIGRALEKGYAAPELSFTDAASIPDYAGFYIRTMVSQGILSGYADGTFRPNNPITRGQMAKILYTMM